MLFVHVYNAKHRENCHNLAYVSLYADDGNPPGRTAEEHGDVSPTASENVPLSDAAVEDGDMNLHARTPEGKSLRSNQTILKSWLAIIVKPY